MSVADAWERLTQAAERYVKHAMVVADRRGTPLSQADAEIQVRSRSAGLAGTVVPVWDSGGGLHRSEQLAPVLPQPEPPGGLG
jgi:hypothetical protein